MERMRANHLVDEYKETGRTERMQAHAKDLVDEYKEAGVMGRMQTQRKRTWLTSAQCVKLVACDLTDEIFICSSLSFSLIVPTNATNSSGDILSSSVRE
jgi:hypothetical protein